MQDQRYGYHKQVINGTELIFYDKIIYVPLSLHRPVIYFPHIYLNHTVSELIANTIHKVF